VVLFFVFKMEMAQGGKGKGKASPAGAEKKIKTLLPFPWLDFNFPKNN